MNLPPDPSLQLAWLIANAEAKYAGEGQIRPLHLFLGILKVIDPPFLRRVSQHDLPEAAQQQLVQTAKQVRLFLEMPADRITSLRRHLRGVLRRGQNRSKEPGMLHRTADSRMLFRRADTKAQQDGCATLSILHLTDVLFESDCPDSGQLRKLIETLEAK